MQIIKDCFGTMIRSYSVLVFLFISYKEMQISVKNVTWDLRLKRAYIDGPQCPGGESMADSAWSSDQEKKTYTDGRINDPTGKGYFFILMFYPQHSSK